MTRKFLKYKLLLDEGLPYRMRFPITNARYDLKHVKGDLKKSGLPDEKVFELALQTNRILVVFNVKDYHTLASRTKQSGIIGISQNLPTNQIDKKLTALLMKSKPKDLYGKYSYISGETRS